MSPASELEWDHYYTYEEIDKFLRQAHQEHPNLLSFGSIGKSFEGREVYCVTLSDRDARAPENKPGYYIDANHHAGEVTGSMVVLYLIDYLLSGFGEDAQITRLLERYTLYMIPRLSPDGSEKYLTTPHSLRSSVRPWPARDDWPEEGLYPADVDENGLILQMRVPDPRGAWRVSGKDPRLMVLRDPDEDDRDETYYHLYTEGLIENFDGVEVKSAPNRWGIDLNRNYPFDWKDERKQSGSGPYPLSEPETYNVARFFAEHKNIAGATSFHTTGGIILRPPCSGPDRDMNMADVRILEFLGRRGGEITGYPCESVYEAMTLDKNRPTQGSFIDFAYGMYGVVAFAPELWNLRQRAGIPDRRPGERYMLLPKEREEDDLKVLRWLDENAPESFCEWQAFDHPQLGQVEIGGIDFKYAVQNPPVSFLKQECDKNALAVLSTVWALPRLEIEEFTAQSAPGGLIRVEAVVANEGWLSTAVTGRAREISIDPPRYSLKVPDGVRVVMGEFSGEIEHLAGREEALNRRTSARRIKLSWLISGESGAEIQLNIDGNRAGSPRANLKM